MKQKIMSAQEALEQVKPGASIMIGGFLQSGSPDHLIRALVKHGAGGLCIISSDSGNERTAGPELTGSGLVKKIINSYIGCNPVTVELIREGRIESDVYPMGTFVEKIRAGGCGLGAVITDVGMDTVYAEGKPTIELEGKTYLIEMPLKADVAIIHGAVADERGNLALRGTAHNYTLWMAMAADYVVAEAGEIVPVGALDPETVDVPGILVDALVKAGDAA